MLRYSIMMWMTLGWITISIGKITFIARGMPSGMQMPVGSLPWPPSVWSARPASKIAWYSGVSGACWPRPTGLVMSHWLMTDDAVGPRLLPLPGKIGIFQFVEGLGRNASHDHATARRVQ